MCFMIEFMCFISIPSNTLWKWAYEFIECNNCVLFNAVEVYWFLSIRSEDVQQLDLIINLKPA